MAVRLLNATSSGLALQGGTGQLDVENSDGLDGNLSRNEIALVSCCYLPLLFFSNFSPCSLSFTPHFHE